MFKFNLIASLRSLKKHLGFTLINIGGLAIGTAATLLITLFVLDEFSYDTHFNHHERIVRIDNKITIGETTVDFNTSAAPVAQALLNEYPEIESACRLRLYGTYLVKPIDGAEFIKEEHVGWADSTFFTVFSIPVVKGNPSHALNEPGSIAISEKIALKYFPDQEVLGQLMVLDNKYTAKVAAVYKDIPSNTHFHFDILISMVGDWPVAREARSTTFSGQNFITYLLLKEGVNKIELEKKLPQFIKKYIRPKNNELHPEFVSALTSITNIYLNSHLQGELEQNSNYGFVVLMAFVGLFILLIACVNFMNMTTARSSNRAKEVGVKKVLGSTYSALFNQFMMESIIIVVIAVFVAILLANLALPEFNALAVKQLNIPFQSFNFYAIIGLIVIVIGLFACVYPSLFLSSLKPINVLKNFSSPGSSSKIIRSSLVVFQFSISILLIIAALAVKEQLSFILNKDVGFEKEQRLLIKDAYALRPNVAAFKTEAQNITSIESVSITGFLPIEGPEVARNDVSLWKEGNTPVSENLVNMQNWRVDHDYISTMGLQVVEGRDFSTEFVSDVEGVILNESAVEQLDLGKDPIGKILYTFGGRREDGAFDPEQYRKFTVIGVVQNFHYTSIKENISPLALFLGKSDGYIIAKFNGDQAQVTIQELQKLWKGLAPEQPFQYSLLDEEFGRMYDNEVRLSKIFTLFAGLAILIACLGLFALTSFTAEQRTKEIGIRKVLGASAAGLVILLSKDFGKLVFIAFIISLPIAIYGVNQWLENYSFKTEIGIGLYVVSGVIVFTIAWITMSFQSFKAASNDPVKSLRSE